MKNFLASEDIVVAVPLTRDGEPFVPDTGTISYVIRGHDGMVVQTAVNLIGITDTTALVPVPASVNAITDHYEKRTILVAANSDGLPIRVRVSYGLTEFLNHSVSADDVRAFIGVDDGELVDSDIDITEAFFGIVARTSWDILNAALQGTVLDQRRAHQAIVAQAVINQLPGLPQRLAKAESDGTSKTQRFDVDFLLLDQRARDQLTVAVTGLNNVDVSAGQRTLIILTTRTDPLTGN